MSERITEVPKLADLTYVPGGGSPEIVYPSKDGTAKPLFSYSSSSHQNPTLCGAEIGQNGTLAVLANAYCRQWECPPPPAGMLYSCSIQPWGTMQNISSHEGTQCYRLCQQSMQKVPFIMVVMRHIGRFPGKFIIGLCRNSFVKI